MKLAYIVLISLGVSPLIAADGKKETTLIYPGGKNCIEIKAPTRGVVTGPGTISREGLNKASKGVEVRVIPCPTTPPKNTTILVPERRR